MSFVRRTILLLAAAILAGGLILELGLRRADAQVGPLTYPEIITALQSKLPNSAFRTRQELIAWVITQIRRRKMDKPLTRDREDDLRQAGATEELINVIRANSPPLTVVTPTPTPTPVVVELGDLIGRATELVRPEYTVEARQAGTVGEVKLALELDETGRVTSVARLTVLPNGLTEKAIDAARRSRFRPAERGGKPAKGTGTIVYSFKLNQINIAATLAAANDLRDRRECARAIAEYGRVLEVDPKNAGAVYGRGTCHLMNGDYSQALNDIGLAAQLNDKDPTIFVHLGMVRDFTGDPIGAAAAYAKAIALQPDLDKQPVLTCLYIDRRSMTADQARSAANGIINACNQALRTANAHLATLLTFKRGIGHRLRSDFERAIADLESVRKANPQFAAVNTQLQIAYNSRGLEAFNKKDYKKAFDDVSLAIQADPQSPTPYINRCAIYLYALKQYREAVNDCSSAIRLSTRSSMAYNHRGYANEMLNNRNEAIADYKKALDLDPQNQAARANLNRLEPQTPSMRNN